MARNASAVLGMLFLAHAATAQFTQQGNKLVGTGAVGAARQGMAVAISGDGTTFVFEYAKLLLGRGGYRRNGRWVIP